VSGVRSIAHHPALGPIRDENSGTAKKSASGSSWIGLGHADGGSTGNDGFSADLSGRGALAIAGSRAILLFYILIALALPLRHADLVIVLLSWVFVVTRFAHAGIFVTSNEAQQRSLAWFAGVLVLFAMWLYFALKILLLI
jgi:uncharacterized MAPEG superfamily protein